MKHVATKFLMLLMLLFISAPRVVAADDPSDWTITTKLAGQAFTPAAYLAFGSGFDGGYNLSQGNYVAKQFAVSNGVIYAITPGQPYWNNTDNNQIEFYNSYSGFKTRGALDSGCSKGSSGRGIAADDNGNIIYAYSSNCDCKIGSIAVLKNSGEYGVAVSVDTRKTILLDDYTKELNQTTAKPDWYNGLSGRTDFFYASGNIYDGTGYMWFTDGVDVVRITIENVDGTQTATKQDVYQIAGSGFVTPTGEYHESRIKPYGDNCFLLQNETGVYDCKLVDNVMQVVQVIRGTNYKLHASNIFNFHGHKILVVDAFGTYNDGTYDYTGTRDGQLCIYDMSTDDISTRTAASIGYHINAMTGSFVANGIGNDVKFTELGGDDDANIDTWCEFELDPNQTQLHLYTYCQSVGFAKFTINAEGNLANPISQVTATLHKHDGHQDAMITWDPVSENPETTQYKVYYQVKPYTKTESGVVSVVDQFSEWEELVTTEANVTTARHEKLKWLLATTETDGTKYYERTYRYKVAPAGSSYALNKELGVVVPELITHSPLWVSSQSGDVKGYGVQTFSGYSQVQLLWSYPDDALEATGYDILRDGVAINDLPIQTFVYVDFDVTKNRDHVYQIRARYGDKYSDPTPPITVEAEEIAQDDAKYNYKIDEIYNYPIDNNDGVNDGTEVMAGTGYDNLGQTRYQQEAYRQASYSKGYWYIAQNHLSTTNDYTSGGGALFRISASDPNSDSTTDRDGNILSAWTKLGTDKNWAFTTRTNFGVAVDDAGNLFTIGTLTSDYGTYEATSIISGGTISKGLLFDCWGIGGGYSDPFVVEFQDEEGNTIDFTEYGVEDVDGTRNIGRVDYYYMEGDVFSAEGGYLYLAPTKTTAVYKFYLSSNSPTTSDNSKVAKLVGKYNYKVDNTINPITGSELGVGNECYAFPVDGRDDIVYNLRSNAYFNVSSDFTSGKVIYGARSRVNNAGGCTIQFNDELFLITPQNQYSQNSGNFYVGMATREMKSDGEYATADEADLSKIVPAAVFFQEENAEAQFRFVNGVWLFAELGLLDGRSLWEFEEANLEVPEAECVYIYMYVPGVRFAKYRLTPNTALPTPNVGISVYPVYKDVEGNEGYREGEGGKELGNINDKDYVEIDRFMGEVSFDPIQNFGTSAGSSSFEIMGYQLTVFDKYGNIVMPAEGYDADDNTTDGVINIRHNSVAPIGGYKIHYSDLERSENNTYTAKLVALFKGVSGINKDKDFESVPALAEDDNTYVPMAPNGKAVAYRSLEWGDWDADMGGKPSFDANGNPYLPDEDDAYWDVYQVAMNIQVPDFTETGKKEPVSYYTIHVAKTTDGETWTDKFDLDADVESAWVRDVMLYVGKGGELDGVQADEFGYVDCGALYGGKIPGTYTFMSIEDSPKDYPDVYWFEKYFMMRGDEATDVVYKDVIPDLINDRKYYVVAHYAAGTPKKITEVATLSTEGNSKIYAQRHAELTAAVEYENIPTGVEDIELTAKVSVYPIPATVSITIKSAEVIENVEIYSLAGVNVKAFECNGEQVMTVAVDDLAAGYYMLKVNDYAPIKFLKK